MRHLTWLALLLSMGCGQAMAQADPAPPATPSEAPAAAGGEDTAAWTPQACGPEPARPVLDLSDRAKYNRSADVVNDYETKAKTWDACVIRQAKSDMDVIKAAEQARMTAISREAGKIQDRVYAGFGEYTAQFKAAQERFEKDK